MERNGGIRWRLLCAGLGVDKQEKDDKADYVCECKRERDALRLLFAAPCYQCWSVQVAVCMRSTCSLY